MEGIGERKKIYWERKLFLSDQIHGDSGCRTRNYVSFAFPCLEMGRI